MEWVTDFGVSNHTTPDPGNISLFQPLNHVVPSYIAVGNGFILPITSIGDTVHPDLFYLNNILVTPDIIRNLLFIHQFTTDNGCQWNLILLTSL
jgi:Mn2+/Fe2+ NRAMP family transporter